MGSFISLLRDIRTVYRDLKVTLKLTARIVLKVHGIVEDVEQTVQDLKAAVKGLSSKIQPQDGMGEVAFEALMESVETKAISLKTSLIEATTQVFNEDLVRNTQEKWNKVIQYSRQSSEALANIVANSSFNVIGQHVDGSQLANTIEEAVSLSHIRENESSNNNDQALVPIVMEKLPGITDEEEIRDFEVLPLDLMDSFWKCDIGCFNIDCADFRQLSITRQQGESSSHSKKKKTKKRSRRPSKSSKKAAASASSSGKTTSREHSQTPARYHKNRRQPRENVALELIFLIAILYEGVAMSDNDLSVRGNTWNETNRRRAAEIIELDD
ncbi:uncharacterized protein LOC110050042 [Orbicella faveolata]|uniref:uncharacterized protein LOC110050042 n=1 Tax=Orbicella faveolata TaxID=48498 RepID=UPI0009E392FF|nr:uncharacterized protein LOC110050042 [Orbicella faveolata]